MKKEQKHKVECAIRVRKVHIRFIKSKWLLYRKVIPITEIDYRKFSRSKAKFYDKRHLNCPTASHSVHIWQVKTKWWRHSTLCATVTVGGILEEACVPGEAPSEKQISPKSRRNKRQCNGYITNTDDGRETKYSLAVIVVKIQLEPMTEDGPLQANSFMS